MKTLTHFGIRRMALGWMIYLIGMAPLLWLHTFINRAVHRAIPPLLLLLWIVLLLCVWDGCKVFSLRLRVFLFSVQLAASVVACMLFVLHLIRQSL
jgi:hypothetical protein